MEISHFICLKLREYQMFSCLELLLINKFPFSPLNSGIWAKMEAIGCVFCLPITSSAIYYPLKRQRFVCADVAFHKYKTSRQKKKCLLPWKLFEIHSAYINKFGCVYSVSLLITWIQWYFQDETSHKFGLTSKEALCMRRKCVHIMFSLPFYTSEPPPFHHHLPPLKSMGEDETGC